MGERCDCEERVMAEKEYIERETAVCVALGAIALGNTAYSDRFEIAARLRSIPAADVRPVPDGGIGEMSDGYHTFNGLYYQRMVLFAALVKAYRDKAWKSYRHEDGELCFGGGWFVVGIETPEGNYTYHYENKDFDLFDCKELPTAPHWDGHTEDDVTRLLSLPDVRPARRGKWKYRGQKVIDDLFPTYACSVCHGVIPADWRRKCNFCPNCGARMGG